jgi:hypothetical protein
MAWVKLDDTFADHPKVDALLEQDELRGLAAIGLYALALSRCGQQLTDGHISTRALRRLAPEHATELAEALGTHGLLDGADGGYQVHDYLDHQPSRAEVLERRRRDAERKAEARAAGTVQAASKRTSERTTPDVPAESERTTSHVRPDVRAESDAPSVLPDPTRPDPKQQINSPGTTSVGDRASASGKRTTSTSISEEQVKLADKVCGILQRGVDGLTTTEPVKAPTRQAVLKAHLEHKPTPEDAEGIAIEVRSIAQSQNRAPNIVGLYARRLADHAKQAA